MHENVLSNDSITDVMIWPGGLHMVDIEDPLNPQFLGCFAEDGYVHDSHCVIYEGPDTRWVLRSRLSLCHLRGTRYTVGFTFTTLTVSATRDQIHGGFYVHDSHCVIYEGPDTRWVLRSRLSLCQLRGTRYTVGFTFTTLTVSSTRDQIHGGFYVHDSHCVIYEGPDTRWVLIILKK